MLSRLEIDQDLETENLILRNKIIELNLLLDLTRNSTDDARGSSWLQRKNSAQRKMLRALNIRIRAHKLALTYLNRLGYTLNSDIIKAVTDQAELEGLDPKEILKVLV